MTVAQSPADRDGDARRRNMLLLYVLTTISTTSNGSMSFILPLNLDRLGHPLGLVGTIVALIGLGSLLSRLAGGAWYRLSRARWLSAASFALMGCSTISLGLSEALPLQAVFAGLHGFTFGLASTLVLAVLIDIRPREDSAASTMSWYTASLSTGYALSALVGAQSIERLGHNWAFLVSGLIGLAGAALVLSLRLPAEAQLATSHGPRPARRDESRFRLVLRLPAGVWLGTLLVFYLTFLADTYQTYYPIYAVAIGVSVGTIGFLKMLHSIASTTVRFAGAGLFRLVPVGVVNHVMALTMAAATIALSVPMGEVVLILVFTVLGVCRGLLRVTSATIVAEQRRHQSAGAGLVSGVYNAGADLADLFGPPLVGTLAAKLSIPVTLTVVGLVMPAIYYALWFGLRVRRRPATSVAPAGAE